ncbi:hypothetical protein H6G88_03075 [Bifidobacterium ruminantium]|nr:hypothetical protein [Bifidobacterium ruminantium]MBM6746291.1 hypothetical protein [Bifidobacterium ruminantium]
MRLERTIAYATDARCLRSNTARFRWRLAMCATATVEDDAAGQPAA